MTDKVDNKKQADNKCVKRCLYELSVSSTKGKYL